MAYGVEKMKLGWAVGKFGDGSWQAAISAAEERAAQIWSSEEDGDTDYEWARDFLRRVAKVPHQGDCGECRSWMRAPITCEACVYDEYMAQAWKSLEIEAVK